MPRELSPIFASINDAHFDSFLDPPVIRWNSRLRSSAGRFIPGSRKFLAQRPPVIEIASYLNEEANADDLIRDTMAHEMIHYWLWVRRQPYGHTPEFYSKMTAMGVSRYNPVPRTRPYRYAYRCGHCDKEFLARRRLGVLACATCCKAHSNGRYDARFRLLLHRRIEPGATLHAHAPVAGHAPASANAHTPAHAHASANSHARAQGPAPTPEAAPSAER